MPAPLALKAVIGADVGGFLAGMDKVGASTQAAAGIATAAIAAIAAAIAAVSVAALNAAEDFEMLELRLKHVVGGAEEAKMIMKDLRDLANQTAFETRDIADAFITMQRVSGGSLKTTKDLELIAGAAAIAEANLGETTRTISKFFGALETGEKGAATESLRQLVERGIITAQQFKDIKDSLGDSQVAAKKMREAIEPMREILKEASDTLRGLKSTLRGVINDLLAAGGEEGLEGVKDILRSIIEFVQRLQKSTAFKDFATQAGVLVGLLAEILTDGQNLETIFFSLEVILKSIADILRVVNMNLAAMKKNIDAVNGGIDKMLDLPGARQLVELIASQNNADITRTEKWQKIALENARANAATAEAVSEYKPGGTS